MRTCVKTSKPSVIVSSSSSTTTTSAWVQVLPRHDGGSQRQSRSPVTATTRTATTRTATTRTALQLVTEDHEIEVQVPTLDGIELRGPISMLGNAILVKVKDTLTSTGGGILLPDQSRERATEGIVLEAGPGKIHPFTAVRITNPIQAGMAVLYGKYDGRAVEYKGEECQVIRDDDCLLYYTTNADTGTMTLEATFPVRDYVLIELEKSSEETLKTASGVVIAAQVLKNDVPCQGRVAKVGPGRMASNGTLTKSPVQPGDLVKFRDYAGNEVMIQGKPYSVVKMVDILCTLNPLMQNKQQQ
jgi:chaperonin GroES